MVPVFFIFYFFLFFHLMNNYSSLPPMITTHYDADGSVVRVISKQDFVTYHIAFAVIISGIFPLIGRLLTSLPPQSLILPHKDYWLAPERRKETLVRLRADFAWLGIVAGGAVIAVDHKLMKAASKNAHGLQPDDLKQILFWAGLLMAFFLMRMILRLRRPNEEATKASMPPAKKENKPGEDA